MPAQTFLGDNVTILRLAVPDASVQLTVTSPPYDNLRTYNGFTWDFESLAQELYRVTKPGGVIVWVVADATVNGSETGTSFRQALYFKECGFNLHDTMIWRKTDPMPYVKTARRYTPAFEYMFCFSKGMPSVYAPLKVPCQRAGQTYTPSTQYNANGTKSAVRLAAQVGKVVNSEKPLTNVWDISTGRFPGHPAPFPEALARDHILSWSNPGDTVLDPFLGSGTTGKMAVELGREFIGIEISEEYLKIAQTRIAIAEYEKGCR